MMNKENMPYSIKNPINDSIENLFHALK